MQMRSIGSLATGLGGRRGRMGAATMEYVIIAILIAAACLVGVIVFNRAIIRNGDVANKALVGRGTRAGEAADVYRKDTEEDLKEAAKFPGEFSDVGRGR